MACINKEDAEKWKNFLDRNNVIQCPHCGSARDENGEWMKKPFQPEKTLQTNRSVVQPTQVNV